MSRTMKTCFVISPIGENGSATRKRADQVYSYIIEEVLSDGWSIERADRISEPGIITNQIIDRITSADLVIADLSERNPNVFYELAIRHMLRKPYVHLIAHDEDIPFDNAPVRAIKVDITDLDSVHDAKKELSAQVGFALGSSDVESPISVSMKLTDLKKDGDSEAVVLTSVLSEMNALRRQFSNLTEHMVRGEASYRNVDRTPYGSRLDEHLARPSSRNAATDSFAASSTSETAANAAHSAANAAVASMYGGLGVGADVRPKTISESQKARSRAKKRSG
ncbi:hypothetical protein [Qipengyuania flava]|uniref:hypothetical protein n=1 Tax=Qipengyuania flava TaxID=192812 RepID=UPI00125D4D11|nr:hypothetical protein [Qipengyuania flava]